MVDIRRLKIFSMVAETGNMTTAADRLFVSQPTVSQTVAELEDHYKTKLVERYPKGLCLTVDGKRLLTYAKKILEDFSVIEHGMPSCSNQIFLRLGGSKTVGRTMMSDLALVLKRRIPQLTLYVSIADTRSIEEQILRDELDVAIVEGEIKNSFVVTEPVMNDCLVLFSGREHRLVNYESINLQDLAGEVFILPEKGSRSRTLFENVMHSKGVPYRVGWESNCAESIKKAVICNHGLAMLSGRLVAKELASGEINFIPIVDCMWKRHYLLVHSKNKKLTEPMNVFITLARRYEQYGFPCPMSASDLLKSAGDFCLIE